MTAQDLSSPFKIDLEKDHPFLTLHDYFRAIETFLRDMSSCNIFQNPDISTPPYGHNAPIERLCIRSEKHGAFHHIASVEIAAENRRHKFAVMVALSKENGNHLRREFHILRDLKIRFPYPYLPNVFAIKEWPITGRMRKASWTLVLAEWYENYYEWHFAPSPTGEGHEILLWDYGKGYRWLTRRESIELIRQAARILTLYLDSVNFSQIYPWHHGAGDFVVKIEGTECTVRLTTVRNYKPILFFPSGQNETPYLALLYFLLNMTIRMRLDREQGVGSPVWTDPWVLSPVVEGFFDGIQARLGDKRNPLVEPNAFRSLLKSFTKKEFGKLLQPLLGIYETEEAQTQSIIGMNLGSHGEELYRVFQALPS